MEDLSEMRTEFVSHVSREVLKQLLDDLLNNCVFNLLEKDSILEENTCRADIARGIIDTVRKKGHKASNIMINCLKIRDPELYNDLCSSTGQAAQPEPQKEQSWSSTLIPSSDAFWKDKMKDENVYPVTETSVSNRVALMITNVKFNDKKYDRNTAEKDESNMEKLLNALGYEVVKYRDLTAKEIRDAIIKFTKHPKLTNTDSVFVVIMSHGKQGVVLGVNGIKEGDQFPIDSIYEHLNTKNCQKLLNKPKVIVIQACTDKTTVPHRDASEACNVSESGCQFAGGEDIEDDALRYVHKEKDFISLLSYLPDTVAGQEDRGSVFIDYFIEVFNTFACKDHVDELFRKVMQHCPSDRHIPTKDRCTLAKCFYLFPGICTTSKA